MKQEEVRKNHISDWTSLKQSGAVRHAENRGMEDSGGQIFSGASTIDRQKNAPEPKPDLTAW